MNFRLPAVVVASFGLLACTQSLPSASRSFALEGTVQISEILLNPTGTDDNNEYVELKCTPNVPLDAYGLMMIEGDYSSTTAEVRGRVDFAKALTGVNCGANGFVVLQQSTVYSGVAETTYVDFFSGTIENGTQTFLLVETDTFPALGTDLDVGDDGAFDDTTLAAKIVDSVSINDGSDPLDLTYAGPVLQGADGVDLEALSRFDGTIGTAATNWYFGEVISASTDMAAGAAPPFLYDTVENDVSPNFPVGGTLSPGAANSVMGPAADMTGAAAADMSTPSAQDLASTTNPDEDLAGQTSSPDLRKPRDLADSEEIVEDMTGGEEADLARRPTKSVERACSAGGSPSSIAFSLLIVAAALGLATRRRRACPITP